MSDKDPIHFIGIGGIGMSGIASMFLSLGRAVQGSDLKPSPQLAELERRGAKIFIGHDASHPDGAGLVVYSSSIAPDHPERAGAQRRGIPVIHRSEALARLCEKKYTITVAGTHGKTTTTALVAMILREAGRDPSVVVGGIVNFFGGNAYLGRGPEIVIEADESDSSFLAYSPDLEVITNIEKEHMDHFGSPERLEKAFRDFIGRLGPRGGWIGWGEDPLIRRFAGETAVKPSLFGFEKTNGFYATDVRECLNGRRGVSFVAWQEGRCLGPVEMKIIGRHNVLNALAAISAALKLGVPFSTAAKALAKYEGAGRRFDVKYEDEEFLVVDDYAHHPTEIRSTLSAAKALGHRRILAVFQPHRYTRTKELLGDFGGCFAAADKLMVTEIYAADEKPIKGVSAQVLFEEIRRAGHRDVCFAPRSEIAEWLRAEILPGDLVIAMGAGDIYLEARTLSEFLARRRFLGHQAKNPFAGKVAGRVLVGEPLARHVTLKVGGPVDFWIEPQDAEDLKRAILACREAGLPVHFFGAGSNLLPPDGGLPGAAIHLGAPYFKEIWVDQGCLVARAGVPHAVFIQTAVENGFGGCEFLAGIPGNVGGLVAMNAGSHGQAIASLVQNVRTVNLEGREENLNREDLAFGYRRSGLSDRVIVEARFLLPRRDPAETKKLLDEYREHRQKTQDLKRPSAGCMFKNPEKPGCFSGRLIEEAGLKGRRIGNAQVSPVHANFIVNLGGATARDVRHLIEEVREAVKEKHGLLLETEVKIL